MKTLTIGKKISFACAALVSFTVLLGLVGWLNIGRMNSDIRSLARGPLPGVYSLGLVVGYAKDEKTAMLEHILTDNPEQKARFEAEAADLQTKFQAELTRYEKTVQTAKGHEQVDKLRPIEASVQRAWAAIIPLSRQQKLPEAMAIWNGEAAAAYRERAALSDEMLQLRKELGDEEANSAIARGDSASFWSILILVVSVASGAILAFFIIRGINRVLLRATTELSEGAEQVSSASGQVSGSSQSLAQGASEQAASLQETSASSEQMASMTRKNAENSQQAAGVMNTVSQRVSDANRTLADMVKSMEEISESSSKISRIIKVIDEIAFQTNILALNAAVEAARAGEAGMGFAVVAEEVRSLAQRSAQAAKDTAALIEESIQKSGDGSRKLGEVANSIQAITDGATQVKTLVDEVDASSKEQARGIEQISKAIAQMDTVTQQTAANAEESASASEELNAQSQALMAVVGQLQSLVGAGSTHHVTIRHPKAARHSPAPSPAAKPARAPAGKSAQRESAPVGVGAKHGSEFPLDDAEFTEF